MRYVMRIAKSSESSKLWTQLALPLGSMSVGVSVDPNPNTLVCLSVGLLSCLLVRRDGESWDEICNESQLTKCGGCIVVYMTTYRTLCSYSTFVSVLCLWRELDDATLSCEKLVTTHCWKVEWCNIL